MATYRIKIDGEVVLEGVHATSEEGAVDRAFDMKRGKISKSRITAVEER